MDKSRDKGELINDFEELVDELVKEEPNENRIKQLMEKLELDNETNSNNRISMVLEKMNSVVFSEKEKKGKYDLR